MTEEQKKKYLESGGVRCPYCNSEYLTTYKMQTDISIAWQGVSCESCGEEWTDQYTLTGVD